MGTPIAVISNMHTCPMSEWLKPHVGGPITGPGAPGMLIDGKPVAVVGDKCICTGGSAPDTIVSGCQGVLIDGKPVAWLGSRTAHGGVVTEGVPGVTISPKPQAKEKGAEVKPEARVFNLQWKKSDAIIRNSDYNNVVILQADTVGYEEGDEVAIKVYRKDDPEPVDELKGYVKDGRVEIEWIIEANQVIKKI